MKFPLKGKGYARGSYTLFYAEAGAYNRMAKRFILSLPNPMGKGNRKRLIRWLFQAES
jgi:hypothetical protein